MKVKKRKHPAWYLDEDILYYWVENGDVIEIPMSKTVLDRAPDVCLIKVSNVSKKEVSESEYQTELVS